MKRSNLLIVAFLVLLSAIVAILTHKFVILGRSGFCLPNYSFSNFHSFFTPVFPGKPVGQTITTEKTGLCGIRLRMKLENFTGKAVLHVRASLESDEDLYTEVFSMSSEDSKSGIYTSAFFHKFTFPNIEGDKFYFSVESEPTEGWFFLGYEPGEDVYSGGRAFFQGAKDGDDLLFDSFTTFSFIKLRWAAEDFLCHVRDDEGFFVVYVVLLVVFVGVIIFCRPTHKGFRRKK